MGKKRPHKKGKGKKKNRRSHISYRRGNKKMVVKKALMLAAVEPNGHSMHKSSGLVLYWLTLLALVVLNMLATIAAAVVQFAIGDQKVLFFVAAMGLFFGYVTYRLVSLIDNLEPRHHFFAHTLVPAASVANLLIVSSASNNMSSAIGIGYSHNPVLVGVTYGASFLLPSAAAAARHFYSSCKLYGRKTKSGKVKLIV